MKQAKRPRQRVIWLDYKRSDVDERLLPSNERPRLQVRMLSCLYDRKLTSI